jgi:hypothetical protein
MYRRVALLAAASVFAALVPSTSYAQTAPAAQAPPAARPWVPPQKGKPARIKGEIQTKIKVKNTSKGSIALLSVEEIWYNTKREIASNGIYRHKQLLNPGEIIEFSIVSPEKPDLYTNMLMFKHANGTVKPNKVPKM